MKILVLRLSSMGDILLASPVLDVLKNEFPGCTVDWVVNKKFEDVLSANPLINRLMVFRDGAGLKKIRKEISSKKYDLIFDLHKNSHTRYLTRGIKNVFSYNKRVFDRFMLVHFKRSYKEIIPVTKMYFSALNKAGIDTPRSWKPRFGLLKDTEVSTVNRYELHNTGYAVFIPGASYATKMWPAQNFRKLAEMIIKDSSLSNKIMILGKGAAESETAGLILKGNERSVTDLTDKLTLQETAAVIKFADIVITNDNGPMHLAECFGKKLVAIFGPTTEEFGFFPYSSKFRVVEDRSVKCRPCTHFGRKKCPKGHFRCMNNIHPEDVIEAVKELKNE